MKLIYFSFAKLATSTKRSTAELLRLSLIRSTTENRGDHRLWGCGDAIALLFIFKT